MGTPVEKFIRDAHKQYNVKYALTNEHLRRLRTKLKLAEIGPEVDNADVPVALDIILADYNMGSSSLRTASDSDFLEGEGTDPGAFGSEFEKVLAQIVTRLTAGKGDPHKIDGLVLKINDQVFPEGRPNPQRLKGFLQTLQKKGATPREMKSLFEAYKSGPGLLHETEMGTTASARVASSGLRTANPSIRSAGGCPRCSHGMQYVRLAESEEARYCQNCHVCVRV